MNIMRKFTKDEQTILKNTPSEYKWIARDEDGDLWIFEEEPTRNDDYWIVSRVGTAYAPLEPFEHMFKGITYLIEPVQFRK